METDPGQVHSFVVKIWREPGDDAPTWRGEVTHVATRRTVAFEGLRKLPDTLRKLTGGP